MKFDFYKNPLRLRSYAKINLYLSVKNKRPDGYHDMEMLMQSVDLYDEVIIGFTNDIGIKIECNFSDIPLDNNNIAYKACIHFFDYLNLEMPHGIRIYLLKTIPHKAGLAGGSGNAAAVLIALNYITNSNLNEDDLISIGSKVGSDVPFCIKGGTCISRGKGDILENISPIKNQYFLIVKGKFGISTVEAFKKLNNISESKNIEECIRGYNIDCVSILHNDFEKVIPSYLNKIKQDILSFGAMGALMSGTGSAFFGVFDDYNLCKIAYNNLKLNYENVYITRPINKGVDFIF